MSVSSTSADPTEDQVHATPAPRRLAVAWQHRELRSIQPVGLLAKVDQTYEFCYVRNAASLPGFAPFVGFPKLDQRYRSDRLFPLFSQRVMDPRRPDYGRFIRSLDLSADATPWEQLARSEGRRSGDTILVFPEPVVRQGGATHCNFLVHGIRHMIRENATVEERLRRLSKGDSLVLIPQPANPVNRRALLTADIDTVPLGWIPDLLLDYVHAVRDTNSYELHVQQINGPQAPIHLRLLVRLSGRVPPGFRAFSGGPWEPLA